MRLHAIAAFFALAALPGGDAPSAFAPQVVNVKGASPVAGRVVSDEGADELIVNTFNSRNKRMTLGVERIPSAKVQKIEDNKNALLRYAELARNTKRDDAAGRLALGNILKDGGFKELAREEFIRAHAADPNNPAPAKAVGDAEWKKAEKSDPRLNAELKTKLDEYFTIANLADRKKAHEWLVHNYNYPHSQLYLERVIRSKQQKTGRQENRKLTLKSKDVKGVYTLYVPASYDPMAPTPFVLALHGGGKGGKDGKDVVGSGLEAMNFYQNQAERHGCIVACPTALAAPWQAPANDALLAAVMEEVELLYNIDENRVYLTGHSMGGFGTWHFGPKWAHLWAAFAPMSGMGGNKELARMREIGMGIYLYHGADDKVVGFGDSHRTGEEMRKDGMDFIYTELPNTGHECPPDIIDECFDYFDWHRLHATPDRSPKGKYEITRTPFPSFERKVNDAEREYFGDPLKAAAGAESLQALVADLKKGGGAADAAVAKIVELKDPAAPKLILTILNDGKEARDARCAAAKALGKLEAPEAAAPLSKAAKEGDYLLTIACADALGAIKDKKTAPALRESLKAAREFAKSKIIGTNGMEYTDYEKCCNLAASLVSALGAIGDAAAVPDIVTCAGEGIYFGDIKVDAEPRAGQDPAKPRKKLQSALSAALQQLGGDAALAFLEKLKSKP
ncbi:MAG: HEAT repeat domain-containing protein [Planctomycetes bacterium]|nr:HEAT repeat domain-containing protein [Planctomycetota bacterium]